MCIKRFCVLGICQCMLDLFVNFYCLYIFNYFIDQLIRQPSHKECLSFSLKTVSKCMFHCLSEVFTYSFFRPCHEIVMCQVALLCVSFCSFDSLQSFSHYLIFLPLFSLVQVHSCCHFSLIICIVSCLCQKHSEFLSVR